MFWEDEVEWAKEWVARAQTVVDADPTNKEAQAALQHAKDYLAYAQESLIGAHISYVKYYVPYTFTVVTKDRPNFNIEKVVLAPTEEQIFEARAGVIAAQADIAEASYLYSALTGGDVPDYATGSGLTELENARMNLNAAQTALDGTRIVAPFEGTVMAVNVSVDNTVSASSTAVSISDLKRPYLEVFLDPTDWAYVSMGNEANVAFDSLPDQTFSGTITQVDLELTTENDAQVIRVLVSLGADFDASVLPLGASASVDVVGGRAEEAVLIPVTALHRDGNQYTVYVVVNGQLEARAVEVGLQDSLYAEILSGVEAGESVATDVAQ
jgi:multidrug efflux pump subunit AcrA (membrane-fusion protein)